MLPGGPLPPSPSHPDSQLSQALCSSPGQPGYLQVTGPALKPVELGLGERIFPGVTRECLGAQFQGSSWVQCQAPTSQLSGGGGLETKQLGVRG